MKLLAMISSLGHEVPTLSNVEYLRVWFHLTLASSTATLWHSSQSIQWPRSHRADLEKPNSPLPPPWKKTNFSLINLLNQLEGRGEKRPARDESTPAPLGTIPQLQQPNLPPARSSLCQTGVSVLWPKRTAHDENTAFRVIPSCVHTRFLLLMLLFVF